MSLDEHELAKTAWGITSNACSASSCSCECPVPQLVYVTSVDVDPAMVDYHLHLLPGIPASHLHTRLVMVSCEDPSLTPLSAKILARPAVLDLIRISIRYPDAPNLTGFNSTALERPWPYAWVCPCDAVDPRLSDLGNKTMRRNLLRA